MNKVIQKLLNRQENANKYDFGHLLILGGSPGMVGAPLLAGEAALRIGAGLVTVASTLDVVDKLERRVEEIMTFRIGPRPSGEILDFISARKVTAVIIGPGLSPEFGQLVRDILPQLTLPVVLDAGGLTCFADFLDELHPADGGSIVITPHSGEFRKLTGKEVTTGHEPSKKILQAFSAGHKATVILKGYHSLIAHPDGKIYENTTGNPGLATAGTGDVLSGLVGGLLAQGFHPGPAAETAVYLHGLAGDLAAQDKTVAGLIASDVVENIPEALKLENRR